MSAASRVAMAARVLSFASATSRADPARLAPTMRFMPCLGERGDVSRHGLDVCERCALRRQQLMAHRHEMLGDDMEPRVRHEMMNVGDPAGDRVSTGIMPRSASPLLITAKASSKVAHGIGA